MKAREVIYETISRCWDQHPLAGDLTIRIDRALEAAGFAIVPIEPSEKMVKVGRTAIYDYMEDDNAPYGFGRLYPVENTARETYTAMLKAAKEEE